MSNHGVFICDSDKPGRQDMTKFIQLGSSGQDFFMLLIIIELKRGNLLFIRLSDSLTDCMDMLQTLFHPISPTLMALLLKGGTSEGPLMALND